MAKRTTKNLVVLLFIGTALGGCKDKPEIVESIRAIKTITVNEMATGQTLKFSGLVAAVDSSGLSFEVSGQVVTVNVDIGESVKKGQVLAELDPEPYQLDLDQAEAELVKARDNVTQMKTQYERSKRIFEQGAGSESSLDVDEYNYKAAESAVNVQVARLNLAKRNLNKTKLLSPYDGTIAWRSVEPHEEVQTGQKLFDINAIGKMEVQLAIQETIIDRITVGDAASISFPTLPGASTEGQITDIGDAALQANAFPVKVELIDPDKKIKPGMTAVANLSLKHEQQGTGYLVPLQAILPMEQSNRGSVFVYNTQTSTVTKVSVRARRVESKKAVVEEGLVAGDVIAVAGVSFLADGMKVKLMED